MAELPAHGAELVPAVESDGEGVDGVALRLANPKVATAQLDGGSSGGERRPKAWEELQGVTAVLGPHLGQVDVYQ
uniref:DUF834 domain-containing protein n=1 Tax=Oryza glaberrima TaxID=4538 RepID=A0A679BA28_ORYGL|nr:hypothetical protein [Oryza glaberrima]